jgi:hypothetical protein
MTVPVTDTQKCNTVTAVTLCFQSGRIAGTCRSCETQANFVHCPKRLKTLHCEKCCPLCSPQVALVEERTLKGWSNV